MNKNLLIGLLAVIVIAGLGFSYWKSSVARQMMMQGQPTPTPLFTQGTEQSGSGDAMKPPGLSPCSAEWLCRGILFVYVKEYVGMR
jgi:hypothetical protein